MDEIETLKQQLAEAKAHSRVAFVEGASWWEFYITKATMWGDDRRTAEAEAERRYPGTEWPTHPERVRIAEASAKAAEQSGKRLREVLRKIRSSSWRFLYGENIFDAANPVAGKTMKDCTGVRVHLSMDLVNEVAQIADQKEG